MKIIITVRELVDLALWEDYCSFTGKNPYALKEGLLSPDEEVTLTIEEAKELGLI